MFDLGMHAGFFVAPNSKTRHIEVFKNKFIGIVDHQISKVSDFSKELADKSKQFIDAGSNVVMPGLINGHTHLPMTLFRGLEDDRMLEEWLFGKILPLEASMLDADFVRVGTELAVLECIRFGTTTVNDMYYFTDVVASVCEKAGLRALIGQPFASIPLPEDRLRGSDKSKLFIDFFEKFKKNPLITPVVAPHAPYTCDDNTFKEVRRLAEKYDVPIHVHLSETKKEVLDSVAQFGKTPVKRLYDLGVLTSKTICAHLVHLDLADQEIFKKSGAAMVYNPDSNIKLSSGIAPVAKYLEQEVRVSIGSDGAASNNDLSLFGAMDLGTKAQKQEFQSNTAMVATQALYCATLGGAQALGLDSKIGSLEEGKEADLIIVDLDFPHLQPVHDIASHLVYSCQGLEVDTVVIRGKVVMKDKKFQTPGIEWDQVRKQASEKIKKMK